MRKLKILTVAVMTLTLSACSSTTESEPQACSVADIDYFKKMADQYYQYYADYGTSDTSKVFNAIAEAKKQTNSKRIKDLYTTLNTELAKKGFDYDPEDSVGNLIEEFENIIKNNQC